MNDAAATPETLNFGAEVGRLLDLVVHSLYSEREIFLRELVANAADAIDRRRFEALTEPSLAPPAEATIRLVPDKSARSLLISDDGIGMTRQELIDNLGTIARSGTRAFGEKLAEAKPEERPSLIGQFGVGFYAAFMVAERVEVVSRKAGSDEAFAWASDGTGGFTIAPARRLRAGHRRACCTCAPTPRNTSIRCGWRRWCANGRTTSPCRSPSPATARTSRPTRAPRCGASRAPTSPSSPTRSSTATSGTSSTSRGRRLHWRAEGMLEFFALLFIPGSRPFDSLERDREARVRLHVRRMFITDKAELLPVWLRFVEGVVDTEDLPLNVSREMLQTTPVLARIRKALIGRVLAELKTRAKDADDYAKFWENFRRGAEGRRLGGRRTPRRDRAAAAVPLLRAGRMDVAAGLSRPDAAGAGGDLLSGRRRRRCAARLAAARGFPRARDLEVLLLADSIDAFWPDRLDSFEGKPLRSVTQARGGTGEGRGAARHLGAAGGAEGGARRCRWRMCGRPDD